MNTQRYLHRIVKGSKGPAVWFAISCSLREVCLGGVIINHSQDEVISLIQAYCRQCAINNEFYAIGDIPPFSRRVGVLLLEEGNKKRDAITQDVNEPRLEWKGIIDVSYNVISMKEKIEGFLNGLACVLADALNQSTVEVSFNGYRWLVGNKKRVQHFAAVED